METETQKAWGTARDELVTEMKALGFPKELGEEIAKNLGSPKAMKRMTSWLRNEKPGKVELVVDEMLAICSEIRAWREKKVGEAANSGYNEMLYHGLAGRR